MKILTKTYYRILFKWLLKNKKRKQNEDVDNMAGITVLNSQYSDRNQNIPKIIWMYWEGKQSSLLEACVRQVRKLHPDYIVHFLDLEKVQQYSHLDLSSNIIKMATPQQRADLIRLDLIYYHGGIWLDASTIVYEKLDWIENLINQTKTNSFSYYRSKNTTNFEYPVIENWLLASVPNNQFYLDWKDELLCALEIGPKQYIEKIKHQPDAQEYFQKIGRLEYLIAYVVCQKVMRKYPVSMVFLDCDKNALLYQVDNGWMKEKVLIDMAINVSPKNKPKLIKLAGKERKILENHYAKAQYLPNSLLDI
jgi:hypothetical protein